MKTSKLNLFSALLLLMTLAFGQTAWAQLTWSITATTNGNKTTFEISRSGDYLPAQTVGYRTISLSAFAGQHFTNKSGTLTFTAGQTSRTVQVTELTASGMYQYQEGTTRTYRFEVYDHNGTPLVHDDHAMTSGSSVASSAFQEKEVAIQTSQITVTDAGYAQAYYAVPVSTYFNNTAPQSYFTTLGVQLRMLVTFDAREKDDGYQYIQIIHNNTSGCDTGAKDGDPGTINLSRYMAGFTIDGNVSTTYYPYTFPLTSHGNSCGAVTHPWTGNSNGNLKQQYFNTNCRATDGRLIIPTNLNTLGVRFNASGNWDDNWYAKNVVAKIQAIDVARPTILDYDAIVLSDGIYMKGNTVYVSIPFSEIVVVEGSPSLITSWGSLSYCYGSGSNVLTFSGNIGNTITSGTTFKVSGMNLNNASIKDRSNNVFLNPNPNKTFDGKKVASQYTINYALGGGTLPGNLSNPTKYCNQSLAFTLINPTTTPGMSFDGWTGSNGSTPQTTVTIPAGSTGSKSYTANFTISHYTVRYNKNAEGATGTMADQEFVYGVAQNLTPNAFEYTGHTFNKWSTTPDGTGTLYDDGQEVVNLTEVNGTIVNLYAQWPTEIYTITYILNGGAWPSGTSNPTNYTSESGDITLINPIRESASFLGWTGNDLNGNTLNVTIPSGSTGDRTYTAHWNALFGDGVGTYDNPYIISTTAQLDSLAALVNAGNNFHGKHFRLEADLVYSYAGLAADQSNFTPIGQQGTTFRGFIHGNNHTISGIRVRKPNSNYVGVFGYLDGGRVEYLTLTDTEIIGKSRVGGIVGYLNSNGNYDGFVEYCTVTSSVYVRATVDNADHHGGVVGYSGTSTFIKNCVSSAQLTNANGITGCSNYGGIVGNCQKTIDYCIVDGATIPDVTNAGAIVGSKGSSSSLSKNYYMNCTVAGVANALNVGVAGGDVAGAQSIHNIVITNPEVGLINVSGNSVSYNDHTYYVVGDNLTLGYTNYNSNWALSNFTVDGEAISGNTITMPAHDITISADIHSVCPQPLSLQAEAISENGNVVLNWAQFGDVSTWQICVDDDYEHLIDVDTKSYTLTGLDVDMVHTAKVRAYCSEESQSQWSLTVKFQPTNMIIIGSGTNSSGFIPFNANSNYSLSQQIYTADELGTAGSIETIAFYNYFNRPRSLDIYMKHTDKTEFDSESDMITVSPDDRVFSGTVNFVQNEWTSVMFDEDFIYDGIHNVVIVVDDNTGSSVSGSSAFKVFSASNQCFRVSDDNDINPFSSVEGQIENIKNQIRVQKVSGGCSKPMNCTVGTVEAHNATFSWDAAEGDYFQYGYAPLGTEQSEFVPGPSVSTGTVTITGLTHETDYVFFVRRDCGDGHYSRYVTRNFKTEIGCFTPTDLTVNDIAPTSVTLSWNQIGSPEEWRIYYNNGEENTINITTNDVSTIGDVVSYSLTGLTAETIYTAKVRAYCEFDEQSYWSDVVSFEPTYKVLVGNGELCTNHRVPTNIDQYYSLTQQIYTKEELGEAGFIESIDFYNNGDVTRDLDIYMVETTKTSFENNTDWIPVTASDLVFSGKVTFLQDAWNTIYLDDYFPYTATKNVAIIVDDNTRSWPGAHYFKSVKTASSQAITLSGYSFNLDPFNTDDYVGDLIDNKNQIRILKSELTGCITPRQVAVHNITGHEATLDWAGYNNSYDVKYRTAEYVDGLFENFNRVELPEGWSMYDGQLNDNGTATLGTSTWGLTFEQDHDVFGSRHAVVAVLNYNKKWLVTPKTTVKPNNDLSFKLALTSTNTQLQPQTTGTDDRFIVLISADNQRTWTKLREWNNSGSSFVYNNISPAGDVVTISLAAYQNKEVYIAFYGESTIVNAYNNIHVDDVMVGDVIPAGTWHAATTASTTTSVDFEGLTPETLYEAQIKGYCGNDEYADVVSAFFTTDIACPAPTNFTCSDIRPTSVVLDWKSYAHTWQICINGDMTHLVNVNSKPYTLENLTPETNYTLKVRADYGNEGYSVWTDVITLKTLEAHPKPTNMNASAIYSTGATITWDGMGDSYELQYTKLANNSIGDILKHHYTFDDGTLQGWTTIDANGDGYNWRLGSEVLDDAASFSYNGKGNCVLSQSYLDDGEVDLTPDNYLVSPRIVLGGSISFYACATDANWNAEHFGVAVSTTGNTNPSSFTTIAEWTMDAVGGPGSRDNQGAWGHYTIDLSSFNGQTGYVAIRHFGVTGIYSIQVDEITLVESVIDGNYSWTSMGNVTSPYNFTNLDKNSTYYVKVRANYNDGSSRWVYTGFNNTPVNITETVDIGGYGIWYNIGNWNFIASPLAAAVSPENIDGMIGEAYDFYRLNPSNGMWENYKATDEHGNLLHPDFTEMVNGRGYLYGNRDNVTLIFTGMPNMHASKVIPLDKGFNLIGNPFAGPVYIDRPYYKLNQYGSDIEPVSSYASIPIPACFGALVKATGDNETVTFTRAPETSTGNRGCLNLTLSQTVATRGDATSPTTDKAIVSFHEGDQLAKYIFKEKNAKLYFTLDGEDYAIVNSDTHGEIPVNFKGKNGEYTITVNPENVELSYFHLIDNLTGANTDLLQTPSYTFTARSDDYASRFKLVFNANHNQNNNEDFAFISNGEIIVNGEGTLQVIDAFGRILFTQENSPLTSHLSTLTFKPGVYVLRLINGENDKTQKIVIR